MNDSLQSGKRGAASVLAESARTEEGRTLAAFVYRRLRADILSSRLPPGTKLHFGRLREDYQVGLSPLREALSRLVASGLVTTVGQRGFRVATASKADLLDVAMVRKELEGSALRKSIAHGDDAWEAQVVAARHRLLLLERGNSEVASEEFWEERHREFHRALISACNSQWLLHLTALVNDQFDRYRRMAVENSLSQHPTSLEHQEIMEAALARDADRAVHLLGEHIDQALELILSSGTPFTDE